MQDNRAVELPVNALTITSFLNSIRAPIRQALAGHAYTVVGDVERFGEGDNYLIVTLAEKSAGRTGYLTVYVPKRILNTYCSFENNSSVLVTGSVNVYNNEIQLYAITVQALGLGKMQQDLNAWKQKYSWLFARPKKRLPLLCSNIAVISSAEAQGFSDFDAHLEYGRITLFPAKMQGQETAMSVAHAIEQANAQGFFDCICIVRGGGGSSELFEFNRPEILESIERSKIPVLTAIGHETDNHLCDYAADSYSATPTALANFLTDHTQALLGSVSTMEKNIASAYGKIQAKENHRSNMRNVLVGASVIIGVLIYLLLTK